MRYWTKAPEPGSFREEIALAVEAFEEFRNFEYLSAVIVGQHYARIASKESYDAMMKMINSLQGRFFGGADTEVDGTKKVAEKDQEEFLDLMENTFAVVHGDRIRQAAAKAHQQSVPLGRPIIYNEDPKGRLLE